MKRIAIFASGAGSNAEKIIQHLSPNPRLTDSVGQASPKERGAASLKKIEVALIVCNKPGAGVLKIAEANQIPSLVIDKEKFFRGNGYVDELKAAEIDFIVLAGFLWKLPSALIRAYPKKIVNIHPALLPNYGGKGMYGHFVHEAVIASGDKESGISIHYVDELYDHGPIILQAKCAIEATDTPDSLAKKVQALEHRHYPPVIALLATL
jgi:phosphoribosylglycinamide formyltransferase-1